MPALSHVDTLPSSAILTSSSVAFPVSSPAVALLPSSGGPSVSSPAVASVCSADSTPAVFPVLYTHSHGNSEADVGAVISVDVLASTVQTSSLPAIDNVVASTVSTVPLHDTVIPSTVHTHDTVPTSHMHATVTVVTATPTYAVIPPIVATVAPPTQPPINMEFLSPTLNPISCRSLVQPSFLHATYKNVLLDTSLQGMVAQEIGFPPTAIETAPEHAIVVYQSDGHTNDSTTTALSLGTSPILQHQHAQNNWHPALDTDFGYNDSDYYQDTLGSDALGHDDYEDTDDHTYEDITDGSEGTHMKKKKDRRKLKGLASTPTATIDDFTAQSRLIDMRIRKRGRPPGSRNRTYFDGQRTMSTRATKATSD